MTEHQRELTEALRTSLDELNGDILALENFCRCLPNDVKHLGSATSVSHLQRIGDYIQQHTEDVRQITSLLLRDIQPQLRHAAETERVL